MDPLSPQSPEPVVVPVRADTAEFEREMRRVSGIGKEFAGSMIRAFEGIAVKGRGLGDVLKSLALQLSQLVLKAAMKPLEQGLGSLFSNLFAGGFGFAKGGVVRQAMPVPFAAGGVIQSPIAFSMRGGRMGLAGEAGPEAIMPLSRGPDGRLGIAARGTGSAVNVTFNIATPDAESFRRSETQLGAMLARAVAMGQRNL